MTPNGRSPLRIVVAVDSFKGSLSAPDACRAIAEGIVEGCEAAEVLERPMADGGEGTAAVMLSVMPGEWVECEVTGPLPDYQVTAGFAWFPRTRTALVEMAAANGIARLDPHSLDPMNTTTLGTGQLMAAAMGQGAEQILLAVGGSATVDGGAGAATALGWILRDGSGRELAPGGGNLRQLDSVARGDAPALPRIHVLCDVDNPLLGQNGAARVYGPQKGATPEMIPLLEAGLEQFADCVYAATGRDIRGLPGGGAAGGLAAGAHGLLGAELVRGADTVLEAIGLPEALQGADWVVTGEGSFDEQSAHGKVVSAVVRAGRAAGARTAVIAGVVDVKSETVGKLGIDVTLQSCPSGMPQAEAVAAGASMLRNAGRRFAQLHLGR